MDEDYLKVNMERTGITKIECPYFKISIQKNSTAVNVTNENGFLNNSRSKLSPEN